ncbi:MAG: hypothetical protein LBN30_10735 [Oscillospiraceae bacterium]|jgi:hypothetical protein|nr:hypothetical protein [Oscillospiraceae bacterium]
MSEMQDILIGIVIIAVLMAPVLLVALLVAKRDRRYKEHIKELGYELLANEFYIKDDEVYVIRYKPENAVQVEVIGLSQITRNAKLVQIEIRYRENGVIKSSRIYGSQDELYNIMDRLGYSV